MGLGASGSEHRPPRSVGINPIAWREAAARNSTFWKILGRWLFIAAGLAGGTMLVAAFEMGSLSVDDYRLILLSVAWTEAAVIALIAINTAATAVTREREDGTLDLLLTTPITPATYLGGKLEGLVAYLLPLLAVPIVTLGIAGLHALVLAEPVSRPGTGGAVIETPVVLPEAGLLAAVTLIPFTAFCVMIGLQWSLKSKGTIGAVVATVGVVAVVGGVLSLCGWQATSSFEFVGPALAGLSPAPMLSAIVTPYDAMYETIASDGGLFAARISLAIGATIGAAIYLGIVFAVRASLVRGFDFTVRKLAGTR